MAKPRQGEDAIWPVLERRRDGVAERASGSAGALVYCKKVFLSKAWDRGGTGGNEDFPRAGHLPMVQS